MSRRIYFAPEELRGTARVLAESGTELYSIAGDLGSPPYLPSPWSVTIPGRVKRASASLRDIDGDLVATARRLEARALWAVLAGRIDGMPWSLGFMVSLPPAFPAPRIYIMNGVLDPDDDPEAIGKFSTTLAQFFVDAGYPEGDVVASIAAYNAPGTGAVDDAAAVYEEYLASHSLDVGFGAETLEQMAFILRHLESHPLRNGQEIILIGHSGGGALAANVAASLRQQPISSVITLGSPAVNWARIEGLDTLAIYERDEVVGRPYLWTGRPDHVVTPDFVKGWGGSAAGPVGRFVLGPILWPVITTVQEAGPAHTSYDDSAATLAIIAEMYPQIGERLRPLPSER